MMQEFSSFRDPSGAVFTRDGVLYRQVNACYQQQFDRLTKSGLYQALTQAGLLVEHDLVPDAPELNDPQVYCVIRPRRIPFISYPYEWSFGQLKDAALATLRTHRRALDFGMILKDASAYNVQFLNGRPLFIDTLSFEEYEEGAPWIAYGQFCRHFLAPLMLMAHVDVRLSQLLRVYIDGIPLDLASRLLGNKGGFAARQHIHWHARATLRHAQDGQGAKPVQRVRINRFSYEAMIDSLIRIVEKLQLRGIVTEWGDYYAHTNYSDAAADSKQRLVEAYLAQVQPRATWDFGANDGRYSRLALPYGHVVAFDLDPVAVERSYNAVKASREDMLPLLLDLTNPSPAIGFANRERGDLAARETPDCIMMLAVIHHMAISNNLPLDKIARWLSGLGQNLIIEFVPKQDSQVQTLLATRADIFPDYTEAGFQTAFSKYFDVIDARNVIGSERTLYLMKAKEGRSL